MRNIAVFVLAILLVAVGRAAKAQYSDSPVVDSLKAVIYDSQISDSVRLQAYSDLVWELQDQEYPADTVIKYGIPAIKLSQVLHNGNKEGIINNNIGRSLATSFNTKCFEYFFRSMDVFDSIGDTTKALVVMWGIATNYNNHNNCALAFEYCRKGIELSKQHQDTFRLAKNYRTMSIVNDALGLTTSAVHYSVLARDQYQLLGDSVWVDILNCDIAKFNFKASKKLGVKLKYMDDYYAKLKCVSKNFYLVDANYSFCISCFNILYGNADSLSPEQRERVMAYMDTSRNAAISHDNYHGMFGQERATVDILWALVNGDYKQARRMVDKAMPMLGDINNGCISALTESIYNYYRMVGDWKTALEMWNKRYHLEQRVYSPQISANNESMLAHQNYMEKIRIREAEARERDLVFRSSEEFHSLAQRFMLILAGILALVIIVVAIVLAVVVGQNRRLARQNSLINASNNELRSLGEKISLQTQEIDSQRQILAENRDVVLRKNRRLNAALDYAQRIQRAMVPSRSVLQQVFADSFYLWKPRDIVSGDFFWIGEDQRRKYLVTADCTGHGVPGALLSMLGISILNDISSSFGMLDARESVELLSATFDRVIADESVPDGMDLSFYSIDKATRKLQFCGAKRPLMVVRDGALIELKPDRRGVGHTLLAGKFGFSNQELSLMPGDMVYTFSDGITDQLGGYDGKQKYSLSKLRKILCELGCTDTESQYRAISESVDGWMSTVESSDYSSPQLDDILIVGVRA